MGIFNWIFEDSVELPEREGSYALERHCAAVCEEIERAKVEEAIKERQRQEEEERRRQKEEAQPKHEPKNITRRYKTIIEPVTYESIFGHGSFGGRLAQLVAERCDGRASVCYKRAGLSRQVYSHIVSKRDSQVTRETAFRLAIGLQLSYEEAVKFVELAGYAFSPVYVFDAVFAHCLKNRIYNIFDVSVMLVSLRCKPLEIV